jgi:hypothetical protein
MNCTAGDLAVIIKSSLNAQVGRIVQCVKLDGSHSLFGPMWIIRSKENLMTDIGTLPDTCHQPDAWLRPIKPGELDKTTSKDKVKETS